MRRLIPRQAWDVYDAFSPIPSYCASPRILGMLANRPGAAHAFGNPGDNFFAAGTCHGFACASDPHRHAVNVPQPAASSGQRRDRHDQTAAAIFDLPASVLR